MSCLKKVTQWKMFAAYLLPSDSAHTEIETINLKCQGDVNECKRELYSSFERIGDRSWTKIVEALKDSSHLNLAEELREDFLNN